jgi:hypothetical protein
VSTSNPSRLEPEALGRIDRLALWMAKRSPTQVRVPTRALGDGEPLSRRNVLIRALGAGALVMVPLRLADPSTARAESYCAARCLDDANSAYDTRLRECYVSSFGTDLPDTKAKLTYFASKIRSGGLGALVLVSEIARADRCVVTDHLRYYYETGKCGDTSCGDAKKYPRPASTACTSCRAGYHCCVCRDYNDGRPLPNELVNGGYSCSDYCTTLGFTVISDTPC